MSLADKWEEYRRQFGNALDSDPELAIAAQRAFYAGAEAQFNEIYAHIEAQFRPDAELELSTVLTEIDHFRSHK